MFLFFSEFRGRESETGVLMREVRSGTVGNLRIAAPDSSPLKIISFDRNIAYSELTKTNKSPVLQGAR